MGIHAHQAATFAAHDADLISTGEAIANKISASRRATSHCQLNPAETAALQDSMTETLEKSRKK